MSDLDQRVTDLEVKSAFSDQLVRDLDAVVHALNREVQALRAELVELRAQVADNDEGEGNKLEDEKPPHY